MLIVQFSCLTASFAPSCQYRSAIPVTMVALKSIGDFELVAHLVAIFKSVYGMATKCLIVDFIHN